MVDHRMLCFFLPANTKNRKPSPGFFVSLQIISVMMYKVRCSLPTPFVSYFSAVSGDTLDCTDAILCDKP